MMLGWINRWGILSVMYILLAKHVSSGRVVLASRGCQRKFTDCNRDSTTQNQYNWWNRLYSKHLEPVLLTVHVGKPSSALIQGKAMMFNVQRIASKYNLLVLLLTLYQRGWKGFSGDPSTIIRMEELSVTKLRKVSTGTIR
jgi:hypothetical protein